MTKKRQTKKSLLRYSIVMKAINIILTFIYIAATTSSLILFKLGNNQVRTILSFQSGEIQAKIGGLSVLGLMLYIVSFILYMVIITRYNLTYIVPIISGIVYVVIFIASIVFLKEKISFLTVTGVIVILIGIIIMNIRTS